MQIVIIGSSAAGISAATEIRKKDQEVKLTIISSDPHIFYHRPSLTEYIGDNQVEFKSHFYPNKPEWYQSSNIDLILNEKVLRIDTSLKMLHTSTERVLHYDKLILAAGASAFVPIKEALKFKNVFTVRTLDDAKAVYEYSNHCQKVTIVGGGLLGLEAANSLLKKQIEIDIIEQNNRVLPAQLDNDGAEVLSLAMRNLGIVLHTGAEVVELVGDEKVNTIRLKCGKTIATDMIIFAIGARPNLELTAGTEIRTDRGILVNNKMETSIPDIYACGDVAQFGKVQNLWMPALKQGKTAGLNAIGEEAFFQDEEYPVMLNSFGIRLFSTGDICQKKDLENYLTLQRIDYQQSKYQKLYFRDNRLSGAILIGDAKKAMELTKAVNSRLPIEEAIKIIN